MIYSDNLQKVFDECKQIQLANPDTTNIWSWNSIFGNLHYYIKRNQVTGEVIKDFWNRQTYFEKNRNYRLQHELPHVYDGLKKC